MIVIANIYRPPCPLPPPKSRRRHHLRLPVLWHPRYPIDRVYLDLEGELAIQHWGYVLTSEKYKIFGDIRMICSTVDTILGDLCARYNLELVQSLAQIGYLRFLCLAIVESIPLAKSAGMRLLTYVLQRLIQLAQLIGVKFLALRQCCKREILVPGLLRCTGAFLCRKPLLLLTLTRFFIFLLQFK